MASQNESGKTPPYVSFVTFINSINKLRDIGLPGRIDPSVFSGQSGSAIAALLAAIRFLGLMDDSGVPTKEFAQLVDAKDEDRPEILRPILLERYAFITNSHFDLKSATSKQVEEAFREQGITGSTVTKSVSFFLAAAQLAGLATSPHVKAPKPPRKTGVPRQPRRRPQQNTKEDGIAPPPATVVKSTSELLLGKFPDFDPAWPDELKQKWFDSFSRLQGMMAGSGKGCGVGGSGFTEADNGACCHGLGSFFSRSARRRSPDGGWFRRRILLPQLLRRLLPVRGG